MAKRYCVMCLADDEREEAIFTTEINGEVAGYCLACAMTMRKNGFAMDRIDLRKKDGRKYTVLTDAQRGEIVESRATVDKIAARYGVSDTTIRSIKNKARAKYLTTDAVKEESSVEACESDVAVLDDDRTVLCLDREVSVEEIRKMYPGLATHKGVVNAILHVGTVEDCMSCGPIAFRAAQGTEPPAEVDVVPAAVPVTDERRTQPVTVPITLELTHETANAIWGGLTLDEKATFCRTKIIERLMEMA